MNADMPRFTASSYSSNSTNAAVPPVAMWIDPARDEWNNKKILNDARRAQAMSMLSQPPQKQPQEGKNEMAKTQTRIVRVFLVDTDDRVPVEKRVLYKSDEMITDATDQELFFSIPVADLLRTHNEFREGYEVEEKDGNETKRRKLKPVRIRDLTMTVTTVAAF